MSNIVKEHIMMIAARAFMRFGFHETGIRQIATEAGVNLSMLNYYFSSKENLLCAVVQERLNRYDARMAEEEWTGFDYCEKLTALTRVYIGIVYDDAQFYRFLIRELLLQNSDKSYPLIRVFFESRFRELREVLEAGVETGYFKNIDVVITCHTIFGTITNSLLYTEDPGVDMPESQAIRMLGYFDNYFLSLINAGAGK